MRAFGFRSEGVYKRTGEGQSELIFQCVVAGNFIGAMFVLIVVYWSLLLLF